MKMNEMYLSKGKKCKKNKKNKGMEVSNFVDEQQKEKK